MKFRLKAPQEKRFFGARDAIGCWSLVIVSARLIWLSLSFVVLPGGKDARSGIWLRVCKPNGLHRVDGSNSPDPTGPRSPLCLTLSWRRRTN